MKRSAMPRPQSAWSQGVSIDTNQITGISEHHRRPDERLCIGIEGVDPVNMGSETSQPRSTCRQMCIQGNPIDATLTDSWGTLLKRSPLRSLGYNHPLKPTLSELIQRHRRGNARVSEQSHWAFNPFSSSCKECASDYHRQQETGLICPMISTLLTGSLTTSCTTISELTWSPLHSSCPM